MTGTDDVGRYRQALRPVEAAAKALPWANERRWRAAERVWWEDRLPVIDLHDLGAREARDVLRVVLDQPPEAGAVVLIHGRGRHSLGASAPLRGVVQQELKRACGEVPEWSWRGLGPGRTVWITDRSRAPAAATGGWSPWLWLLWALMALAFAAALARALTSG